MSRVMRAMPLVVLCALIIAVPSVQANWVQDGITICTAPGKQWNPMIVLDGAGGAIVTWIDYGRDGTSWDICAQRVNPSGAVQWPTNGVVLCTATGYKLNPTAITSDGAGGAIVTWQDNHSGNYDIYAQRVNASGAVQWPADGVTLCTATGDQLCPTITSDGAGGAIITWMDSRRAFQADIYAQRVNALGVVQWPQNGVALCTAEADRITPMIISDGAGGAIVMWQDGRHGTGHMYTQRVNASGYVQWTVNGVALCSPTANPFYPSMTSDGAGGAIVTWEDSGSGNAGIYGQRVDASGTVHWTAGGVAICTAPGDQRHSQITSDGAGGAIATWEDGRSGTDNIYAQRVNASGAVQWRSNGVALCTATGHQYVPKITSDGAGGAIVTWCDARSFDSCSYDIYAQRVNAFGAIQWTTDGVAICTATGEQLNPIIISDGAGGAIVTWRDQRSRTHSHIYALRVDANGSCVANGY